MSDKDDGGSAFPQYFNGSIPGIGVEKFDGMSLRDYFAAMAMQGVLANSGFTKSPIDVADYAYIISDEMLAERNK